MARLGELAYSKEYNRIELVVPHGTKLKDIGPIWTKIFGSDLAARLPRGCPNCHSGDHLLIRERLEHVLQIDLDKFEVIGKG
ncbi:MAG: hypothetical protein QOF14_3674 [Hyphomicrobiales bacterium]|jgi:hypothetical protein|nr:hypothetical protein [Hyphomicrobiales bacterium]